MNGNGFPGAPAMPGMGAMPGVAPEAAAGVGFVLDIPADPTWEPFDTTDVLETDGYYAVRITREGARTDSQKKAGVFLTLEIQDEDARGKVLSKFMQDPRATQKDSWFVWRNLIRSVSGGLDQARAGLRYTTGMLAGQLAYVKTGAYTDGDGQQRTGVDNWCTKDEYEKAVASKTHRWPAKARGGNAALPGGLPSGFPGTGFPGLGGAPGAPGAPGTAPMVQAPMAPQPIAAAPMVQAAPAQVQQVQQHPTVAPVAPTTPGFPPVGAGFPPPVTAQQPVAQQPAFGFPTQQPVAPQPQAGASPLPSGFPPPQR